MADDETAYAARLQVSLVLRIFCSDILLILLGFFSSRLKGCFAH